MAVKTFTADQNKTVTVVGTKYTVPEYTITFDYTDTDEPVITNTGA